MKLISTSSYAIAVLALAYPSTASASLLVGFHDFSGGASKPHDVAEVGFSGISDAANGKSSVGGSNDGFYGTSSIVVPAVAGGDGSVRVSQVNNVFFSLTNGSGDISRLGALFFDAVNGELTSNFLNVSYQIAAAHTTTGTFVSLPAFVPNPVNLTVSTPAAPTAFVDYQDFIVSLASIPTLLDGQTVTFKFAGVGIGSIRIDNLAITAVPEPSGYVALAGMLASGLLIRNRKKRQVIA